MFCCISTILTLTSGPESPVYDTVSAHVSLSINFAKKRKQRQPQYSMKMFSNVFKNDRRLAVFYSTHIWNPVNFIAAKNVKLKKAESRSVCGIWGTKTLHVCLESNLGSQCYESCQIERWNGREANIKQVNNVSLSLEHFVMKALLYFSRTTHTVEVWIDDQTSIFHYCITVK